MDSSVLTDVVTRSSDIQPAFDSVFRDIAKLIDNQISEAAENGLRMKVR
jgi:hypothetical protein